MRHLLLNRTRSTSIQFFRYLFVGASSSVVHFGLYFICTRWLEMHYLVANTIAFVLAFVWNYVTSIFWIFESKHSRKREVTSVLIIATFGMIFNQLLLSFQVEVLDMNDILALIIATGVVMWWNFGMRKWLVFH